ncbi:MAG TPA: hypothetical protein VJQ82_02055, partial [Terriglobales bacterium]|nr:hypothetical protein [Terriglobales bacterium]
IIEFNCFSAFLGQDNFAISHDDFPKDADYLLVWTSRRRVTRSNAADEPPVAARSRRCGAERRSSPRCRERSRIDPALQVRRYISQMLDLRRQIDPRTNSGRLDRHWGAYVWLIA